MEKVVIVGMGVEGGGVTIYGRWTHGVWSFWQEGASMDLDEKDEEVWRGWSSDPVSDLSAALPDKWWLMYPTEVHPGFVAQLRSEYERCRAAQLAHRGQCQQARWRELLATPSQEAERDTTGN